MQNVGLRNARLGELQAGIKTAGRNINNLRYVDNTILMAENEEELKSLLIRVKEESENVDLKLKDTKIMAAKHKNHGSKSHHFMTNRRGKGGSSDRFPILGL